MTSSISCGPSPRAPVPVNLTIGYRSAFSTRSPSMLLRVRVISFSDTWLENSSPSSRLSNGSSTINCRTGISSSKCDRSDSGYTRIEPDSPPTEITWLCPNQDRPPARCTSNRMWEPSWSTSYTLKSKPPSSWLHATHDASNSVTIDSERKRCIPRTSDLRNGTKRQARCSRSSEKDWSGHNAS